MADPISLRAFAKLEGCSHTLVNRAVASGRLPALLVDGEKRIDPDLVGTGWKKSNRRAGGIAPAVERLEPQGHGGSLRRAEVPDDELEPDNWKQAAEALPGKTFEEKAAAAAAHDGLFASSMAEAERRKMVFAALMAEHKYNQEVGSVVPVEAVSEIVGAKFASVRTRLTAIPSEEAPRVHRCKTVAEVEAVLRDVVTEALEEICSGDITGEIQAGA